MRTLTTCIVLIAACSKPPPPAPPPAQQPAPAAQPAASDGIKGTIAEKIDAATYSYLKLRTSDGEVWAAVPQTDKAVGTEVSVVGAAWMQNFESKTLNRKWDRIAFGTLGEGAPSPTAAAPAAAAQPLPDGHPSVGSGGGGLHQHPQAAATADVGPVKVARASGPSGRTIADIWGRKASLKDQKISVRGKVVKATNGVLGKNWIHLRDGTGEGASSDLTVATVDTAAVGDVVLVTGVVHLDRDLGAGYHYEVIVEDAKIAVE